MILTLLILAVIVAVVVAVLKIAEHDHQARRLILLELGEGPRTSLELSNALNYSFGTIHVVLGELERAGHVILEKTPPTAERGWREGVRARLKA